MKTKICFACALLFLAAGLVRGQQPAVNFNCACRISFRR